MIRPFHLEDFVARFHENGNAQSFSACAYCAVLSNDVNQQWRVDEFEPAIRVLIDKRGDEAFSSDATGSDQ